MSDLLRARLQRRDPDNEVAPESRLSLQIFGILLSASGVFTFGWLCAYRVHVAVVLVASVLGRPPAVVTIARSFLRDSPSSSLQSIFITLC